MNIDKAILLTVEAMTKAVGYVSLSHAFYTQLKAVCVEQNARSMQYARDKVEGELKKHPYFTKVCKQNQKRDCKICKDCPWKAILEVLE